MDRADPPEALPDLTHRSLLIYDRRPTSPWSVAETTTGAPTLALITDNFHQLLRSGIRPATLVAYDDLLDLEAVTEVQRREHIAEPVFALEQLILNAIEAFGDGAEGHALRLLFAIHPDTRGRLLKDRRRLAAEQFDVLPSTFRRYYEDRLVEDLATELWRAECHASS